MRPNSYWISTLLCVAASAPLAAQLPPAAEVVPPGFQLIAERNLGGTMVIEATRANADFPRPHMDPGITLSITWSLNPIAGTTLEYLKAAPEDPAGDPVGVSREEPCGKSLHRGGVLTCRKVTTPWVGAGEAPDLVTWNLSWVGASDTGLLGVSVSFFYGDREAATGWVDGVIDKITEPT